MKLYRTRQVKADVDKFFKRLKRHAHKGGKWFVQRARIRASAIGMPADSYGGVCPVSFLANSCGFVHSNGGKFGSGDVYGAGLELGLCEDAIQAIIDCADGTRGRRQRLLKAVGL